SSVFRSCYPKRAKNDQNDPKRDSDTAVAGAGLAGTHRQRDARRVDVSQRLRAARRPSFHVSRAAESQGWFRWVGGELRGAEVRTAQSARVLVVGRRTSRRYAGELPAGAGWRRNARRLRAFRL